MEQNDTFEYAIRKDVRNNPIVREVDEERHRELWQSVGIGVVLVLALLFSAWQHFETLRYGYSIEELRQALEDEQTINRQLRLNVETLRAPQKLEERGRRELGLVTPTAADTLIIERTYVAAPAPGFVARAR